MSTEKFNIKCSDCSAEKTCNEALYNSQIVPTCPQFKNKQVLHAKKLFKISKRLYVDDLADLAKEINFRIKKWQNQKR